MPFPWDNLILAASTLGAALGSAGLTSYLNRKDRAAQTERTDASNRAERQAAAYQAVVASAAVVQHNYSQRWGKFDDLSASQQLSIRSRGAIVSAELLRAIADVQYRGTEAARQSAEVLRRAALDAEDALEYGSADEIQEALENFAAVSRAFTDAIRQPTAPS